MNERAKTNEVVINLMAVIKSESAYITHYRGYIEYLEELILKNPTNYKERK